MGCTLTCIFTANNIGYKFSNIDTNHFALICCCVHRSVGADEAGVGDDARCCVDEDGKIDFKALIHVLSLLRKPTDTAIAKLCGPVEAGSHADIRRRYYARNFGFNDAGTLEGHIQNVVLVRAAVHVYFFRKA
jgi:hypothetical protein